MREERIKSSPPDSNAERWAWCPTHRWHSPLLAPQNPHVPFTAITLARLWEVRVGELLETLVQGLRVGFHAALLPAKGWRSSQGSSQYSESKQVLGRG